MGSEDGSPERVAAVGVRDEPHIDRPLVGLPLGLLILYTAVREFFLLLKVDTMDKTERFFFFWKILYHGL
ncbi:hypothetical protein PJP13_29820, partial [Mycobacterium kansasii]